jgi:hypothetical protein
MAPRKPAKVSALSASVPTPIGRPAYFGPGSDTYGQHQLI